MDTSTHYPAFYTVGLLCLIPTPYCMCAKQGGSFFTIFSMVPGMTRPECEPTIFLMGGGQSNHKAIPTRSQCCEMSAILLLNMYLMYCTEV